MKFLIAPDSYKESMSALCAAKAIEAGIKNIMPDAECVIVPMADGGEGTAECLMYQKKGEKKECLATNPLGEKVKASFALFPEKEAALIEVAEICGLMLIPPKQRNPKMATSYGVGEMICEAIRLKCKEIILTLGGTGTSDGGAGMLMALGGRLLDQNGEMIGPGGSSLKDVKTVDLAGPIEKLKGIRITVLCDVKNQLLGEKGATYVFAPQKGASKADLPMLEKGMENYANIVQKSIGINHCEKDGAGAAGGLGFALFAISRANIINGSDYVMRTLNLEEKMKDCDMVITGEGSIDSQSLGGKVPISVALMAKRYKKPVIVLAGKIGKHPEAFYENGVTAVFSILKQLKPIDETLRSGEANLRFTVENLVRVLKWK